jgi:hypothetical protein
MVPSDPVAAARETRALGMGGKTVQVLVCGL